MIGNKSEMAPRWAPPLGGYPGAGHAVYGGAIGILAGADYELARQDGWF